MADRNGSHRSRIDKRDFDANRPLLADYGTCEEDGLRAQAGFSEAESRTSRLSGDGDQPGEGLLNEVVENIVMRDRQKLKKEIVRIFSFIWSIISCLGAGSLTAFSLYGPLLLTRLHYSQAHVNGVSIAAEIAMYLPISVFGYLCDRYSPSPVSLLAGILFGVGYLLAALSYRSGPPVDLGGTGWPYWVMILAFVFTGMGTCCLYGAAVTTCAKNFGRGKNKGIMLACPIAAFGLSGIWQSQIGSHMLCERNPDGSCGEVDVFRYFLFLSILLLVIGVIGAAALQIVDDEEQDKYIDEAVSELERSGILGEDSFFRPREEIVASYGTFQENNDNNYYDDESADEQFVTPSEEERLQQSRKSQREEEERRKKNWLLNQETRLFLKDNTMWWLAAGFFFVTGPGEAYINNLGTIIQTLTPVSYPEKAPPPAGLASTHVSTNALTSTIARLLVGSITDIFAPPATHQFIYSLENPNRQPIPQSRGITLSRLTFLLPSAFVLSLGFLLLASPLTLHHPELFHVTTGFVGFGYGASFALMPIIISVVWGVENFGTNWGIVAMVPAAGAAFWGIVYSHGYQDAIDADPTDRQGQCFGWKCFGLWAIGCTASIWAAITVWMIAWRGWNRRGIVV
ncbi:putative MFS monocarboxylic acid transporter [Talaromyces proteolyticus]|uniref:Probable transporter MCH1 n=1 Tax=Talaromyces proteolyticus TaxID=1131652 RepID=A0AAD4PVB4_9EURO|nr:putative MFS monocarboxylic acid transporter [Talaromyces proteolyticus]KAH8696350.1 putative MFS monocarboxylic acid transporter [Talaromyces proteolyticus]